MPFIIVSIAKRLLPIIIGLKNSLNAVCTFFGQQQQLLLVSVKKNENYFEYRVLGIFMFELKLRCQQFSKLRQKSISRMNGFAWSVNCAISSIVHIAYFLTMVLAQQSIHRTMTHADSF